MHASTRTRSSPSFQPGRRACLASLPCLPLLLAGCAGAHPGAAPSSHGGNKRSHSNPAAPPGLAAYPPMPAGPDTGADPAVHQQVRQLGRGINFGNIFDAPTEGAWGLRADDEFINLVGSGGFTRSVRLPVRWSNHASVDAAARINPAFMARVEQTVDRLLARGASVLLNIHHYRQFDGDPLDPGETVVAPAVVDVRFLAMWQQIAERFAKRSPALMFEIYNEPHGRLEPLWNDLLSRALRIIRQHNPTRVVVVGPTEWNSANALPRLVLPPDRHVALTVHHYEPFAFTHQGAEWVSPMKPLGVDCCNTAQQAQMLGLLDLAAADAAARKRPMLVGEFGAYSKAPLAARVAYLRFMRNAMEARQLPWMYWELASGFGIYDPMARRMRTELFEALYGT